MHETESERERGRKETHTEKRRNETQKIGMKKCEEQMKEDKKTPPCFLGNVGQGFLREVGTCFKQTNKQKYIKAQISTRTVTFFAAEPTA